MPRTARPSRNRRASPSQIPPSPSPRASPSLRTQARRRTPLGLWTRPRLRTRRLRTGTSAGPSSTPGPTTTTHPPVVRPKSLPVTVSPRAGGPGTTVTVRTDLRGCTRPGSAHGFFLDRLAYGVDGASRRLVREHVTGGRWYSAKYLVTNRDAVGQGEFGVVCDFNLPTATEGHATFRVQPSRSPVPVRVTPRRPAGAPRSSSPPRSGGASGSTSGSMTARARD